MHEDQSSSSYSATSFDVMPLVEIMAHLRDPVDGCPWDVEQTFSTIAPYTIEEAYEVADAIMRNDMPALKDELGDLLLQVVFHARIAEEAGDFSFQDVIDAICNKMVRRHPHVFVTDLTDKAPISQNNWEAIKAVERAEKGSDQSALADVALALPALLRAEKIQKRAARTGFDWPDVSGVVAKIEEEIQEVIEASTDDEREDEVGDLLFAVVNLARHMKVDPEVALRRATGKFERRFRAMETSSGARFKGLSLSDKEVLWEEAKRSI